MNYPAEFSVNTPDRVGNWRVLVHWLLLIPHLIILRVLEVVSLPLWVIVWIASFLGGKTPKPLAGYFVMLGRYENRFWSYYFVLTDRYPPFEFTSEGMDPRNYPAVTDFEVELNRSSRWSALFRPILVIPVAIWYAILVIILLLASIIMFFVLLFTGRWPAGFQRFYVGVFNVGTRLNAYFYFLTDRYPPFGFDASDSSSMSSNPSM